jgi:hypothetical protein
LSIALPLLLVIDQRKGRPPSLLFLIERPRHNLLPVPVSPV